MSKMINIVEDLHKGIDLKELANKNTKTTTEQEKEGASNDKHQGHGE